ncbi:MAG: glycosyltransferase family 4 protein [Proteobacteria bacterium]|nr:glycosyltransferase family 4 protein [Pseudomonadota bacterium]
MSAKKMTVLQILPSLVAGGSERGTVDVAQALVQAGHRALVISAGGRMVNELHDKGAAHFTWPSDSKNPLTILANSQKLVAFIKEHQVDLIHARSRAPAWSVYLASKQAGVPFITTFHAAYKGKMPWKRLYNSVMTCGARVIAVSKFVSKHIAENYEITDWRIVPILRGIDLSVFDPAKITAERKEKFLQAAGVPAGVPMILVPGRLSPIKGQELTLRALAQVKQPFFAVIMGPDQGRVEYRNFLNDLAKDLGLRNKTSFLPGGDMPAAYAAATLVLSTSLVAEGCPRVPVEAQAMGAPVIATALGGTFETIKSGETGWLVPKGDLDALVGAINTALKMSPEERARMVRAGQAFVRANFDMKQMCAKTLKVYEEVLNEFKADK